MIRILFLAYICINICTGRVISSEELNSTIIGGNPAPPHAYPWQISLQKRKADGSYGHYCGGSIIDPTTIVCAAHCVVTHTASDFQIVAGAHFLSEDKDGSWQVRSISKLIPHEKYNDVHLGYDISLIKLSEPLTFGGPVAPVILPYQGEQVEEGTMCENSGWGKTSTDPPVWPDELLVVTIPYVPQDVCKSIWENVGQTIYDGEICAGDLTTNKGPCNGDSGGPMICENRLHDWVLHGIVSWGSSQPAEEGYPAVFTRVSYFMDWIEDNRS